MELIFEIHHCKMIVKNSFWNRDNFQDKYIKNNRPDLIYSKLFYDKEDHLCYVTFPSIGREAWKQQLLVKIC